MKQIWQKSNPIEKFCKLFGYDVSTMLKENYTVVTPDSKNPYKQMYVTN